MVGNKQHENVYARPVENQHQSHQKHTNLCVNKNNGQYHWCSMHNGQVTDYDPRPFVTPNSERYPHDKKYHGSFLREEANDEFVRATAEQVKFCSFPISIEFIFQRWKVFFFHIKFKSTLFKIGKVNSRHLIENFVLPALFLNQTTASTKFSTESRLYTATVSDDSSEFLPATNAPSSTISIKFAANDATLYFNSSTIRTRIFDDFGPTFGSSTSRVTIFFRVFFDLKFNFKFEWFLKISHANGVQIFL